MTPPPGSIPPPPRPDFAPDPAAPRTPGMACAHSRIRSLGYVLPDANVESRSLEAAFELERHGVPPGTIERVTGVRTRRFSDAVTRPSDLAYEAALDAMARGLVRSDELDAIIYAAVSRDYAEPATAHVIQAQLGARDAFVLDVSNACLSIVSGIFLLDTLIGAGRVRTGLVCGGETCSAVLRATFDRLRSVKDPEEFAPFFPSLTLGDAGAALVLEPKSADEPERGFRAFEMLSRGEHHDLCVLPSLGEPMVTDGRRLLEAGAVHSTEAFARVLAKSGWTLADVDLVVPHQIGVRANEEVLRRIGIPRERCHLVVDRTGNTASTILPMALADAAQTGRLRPGMRVVLAGLGSGLSVGFATLVW